IDLQAGIIRERVEAAQPHEVPRLGAGIGLERDVNLQPVLCRRFSKPELVGEDDLATERCQQLAKFGLLATAARGNQQPAHPAIAARCRLNNSSRPDFARSSSESSSLRSKVPCSPVPCTSTNESGASMTTLASTSASRSSRYAR